MDSDKKEEIEICEVPRWQLIKATLNNLDYAEFVSCAAADPSSVMIDVRRPDEYAEEYIEGAINMNYLDRDLADQIEALDNTKNYYIYCRTGRRSLRVCVIMRNLGFQEVYNLEGGIVSKDH